MSEFEKTQILRRFDDLVTQNAGAAALCVNDARPFMWTSRNHMIVTMSTCRTSAERVRETEAHALFVAIGRFRTSCDARAWCYAPPANRLEVMLAAFRESLDFHYPVMFLERTLPPNAYPVREQEAASMLAIWSSRAVEPLYTAAPPAKPRPTRKPPATPVAVVVIENFCAACATHEWNCAIVPGGPAAFDEAIIEKLARPACTHAAVKHALTLHHQ